MYYDVFYVELQKGYFKMTPLFTWLDRMILSLPRCFVSMSSYSKPNKMFHSA